MAAGKRENMPARGVSRTFRVSIPFHSSVLQNQPLGTLSIIHRRLVPWDKESYTHPAPWMHLSA